MTGRMIEFDGVGTPTPGYLATPDAARDIVGARRPGVVVLHAWWGLTEPFREVCDRLAAAGFVALAPDLYRGRSTASVEEAQALAAALNREEERVRGDIAGAVRCLRQQQPGQREATNLADRRGALGVVGFSLGGAYALDMSVQLTEEIAAVVTFYATYTGPDYRRAQAAYLCHFAENDPFEPAASVAEMQQALWEAGRPATFYTYPGTTHWFFEANRADAFNPAATALAWERTLAFLSAHLRQA
jgi:carboxymethylenebutenolidase